jgi:hypothetical protein
MESTGDLEPQVKRFRTRSLILAIASTLWFVTGVFLSFTIFADVGSSITFSIYLTTVLLSPLVALCAFLCVAYARRWVETRAETRRLKKTQPAQRAMQHDSRPLLAKVFSKWKESPVSQKTQELHCQKCNTVLKRRSELEGKKIGGVFTGADMDQFFGAILDSAYQCRNCGYLKCQSCVRAGGGCPSCSGLIFDSI